MRRRTVPKTKTRRAKTRELCHVETIDLDRHATVPRELSARVGVISVKQKFTFDVQIKTSCCYCSRRKLMINVRGLLIHSLAESHCQRDFLRGCLSTSTAKSESRTRTDRIC